jgi:hypothetical protein
MAQQTPSIDWPRRSTALTGNEDLLKQNPISDASPQEERIPVSLILSYIQSNLSFPTDVYLQSLALSGGTTLVATLTDASTVTVDLSSLSGGGGGITSETVTSLSLVGNSLVHTNESGVQPALNLPTTSLSLSGSTLVFTDEDGSVTNIALPSGGGGTSEAMYTGGTGGYALFTSVGTGITTTKVAGTVTVNIPDGVLPKYVALHLEGADKSANNVAIDFVFAGSYDGVTYNGSDLVTFFPPSSVNIIDRGSDNFAAYPNGASTGPYSYGSSNVSTITPIQISDTGGTLTVDCLNIAFDPFSIIIKF